MEKIAKWNQSIVFKFIKHFLAKKGIQGCRYGQLTKTVHRDNYTGTHIHICIRKGLA